MRPVVDMSYSRISIYVGYFITKTVHKIGSMPCGRLKIKAINGEVGCLNLYVSQMNNFVTFYLKERKESYTAGCINGLLSLFVIRGFHGQ